MNDLKRLFLLLGFFGLVAFVYVPASYAKTIYYDERWRDKDGGGAIGDKDAYNMDYKGPSPTIYFMVPQDGRMISRAYKDIYSLEDWSGYEEPAAGYMGDRTDITVEEYVDFLLTNTTGRAPSEYQTYKKRGPVNSHALGSGIPRENLTPESFGLSGSQSGADYVPVYSIRNVAGLIYRDDEKGCDTKTEHPLYDSDHMELRDADGKLQIVNDDKICYFLYLPEVKTSAGKIGPFVGRAQVQDTEPIPGYPEPAHEYTKEIIKQGLAPYLPLKNGIRSRLDGNDSHNIYYKSGRYVVPQLAGDVIVPHNGANVLYNRRLAERPYHHERHEKKVTSSKSSPIWIAIVVGVLTFGVGAMVLAVGTAIAIGVGAGVVTALLLKDKSSTTSYAGTSVGAKGEWKDPFPNKIYAYLALQADDSAESKPIQQGNKPKIFPLITLFMKSDDENDLLKQARLEQVEIIKDGSKQLVPINFGYDDQGTPLPAENQQIASGKWRDDVFPDHRWYQIMKIPAYSHGTATASTGAYGGGGAGTPVDCSAYSNSDATLESQVKQLCTDFGGLSSALDSYFSGSPFNDPNFSVSGPGNRATVKTAWMGSGGTLSVGSRSFDVAPAYKDFNDAVKPHIGAMEAFMINAVTASGSVKPEYKEFSTMTNEGIKLADRVNVLETLMQEVSKEYYYQKWFIDDQDEYSTLKTRADNAKTTCQAKPTIPQMEACFDTEFGTASGIMGEYAGIEDEPATQYAFGCYTAGSVCNTTAPDKGTKVLGFLAVMEDFMQIVAPTANYDKYLAPGDKCPGATIVIRGSCVSGKFSAIDGGSSSTPKDPKRRWPF